MKLLPRALIACALAAAVTSPAPRAAAPAIDSRSPAVAPAALERPPQNAQTAVVLRYLHAMREGRYGEAFVLLNDDARAYYRDANNLASVYAADAYRITAFKLLGARGDEAHGRVYFARETARYRDHAHDADFIVTATVPIGVVPAKAGWRIKDPGHPWRAFAADASARTNGVRVTVKKISFFARRIEAVVSFINTGADFVTILPYGGSTLRDTAGRLFHLIESRDWSLTDRSLFEGLRLAPNAQYTGVLAFACEPFAAAPRGFALTVAPLLLDGGDAPFAIDVATIGPAEPTAVGAR